MVNYISIVGKEKYNCNYHNHLAIDYESSNHQTNLFSNTIVSGFPTTVQIYFSCFYTLYA